MGKIFEKQYGKEVVVIPSIEDIISFQLWPWLIEAYGTLPVICCVYTKVFKVINFLAAKRAPEFHVLPQMCQESCERAMETIKNMCSDLQMGNLTKSKLKFICENEQRIVKIVGTALTSTMLRKVDISVQGLREAIKQRHRELQEFIKQKEDLRYLIDHINVEVEGKNDSNN